MAEMAFGADLKVQKMLGDLGIKHKCAEIGESPTISREDFISNLESDGSCIVFTKGKPQDLIRWSVWMETLDNWKQIN